LKTNPSQLRKTSRFWADFASFPDCREQSTEQVYDAVCVANSGIRPQSAEKFACGRNKRHARLVNSLSCHDFWSKKQRQQRVSIEIERLAATRQSRWGPPSGYNSGDRKRLDLASGVARPRETCREQVFPELRCDSRGIDARKQSDRWQHPPRISAGRANGQGQSALMDIVQRSTAPLASSRPHSAMICQVIVTYGNLWNPEKL
jgi:hypothetical protein